MAGEQNKDDETNIGDAGDQQVESVTQNHFFQL